MWPEIRLLDEVPSTNDVARAALLEGAEVGTAFRATRQTTGRGRSGRTWVSRAGDLFFSVVVRPKLPPQRVSTITLGTAVAVHRVLAACGVECGLKWPNDLLVDDRKLGGILVEGFFDGEALAGAVVGIGINLSLDVAALEPPLCETATSFAFLGVACPELGYLASSIRESLFEQIDRLERGDLDGVLREWHQKSVTLGRSVTWCGPDGPCTGIARDLSPNGGLVVELNDESRRTIMSGEITHE